MANYFSAEKFENEKIKQKTFFLLFSTTTIVVTVTTIEETNISEFSFYVKFMDKFL